MRRRPQSGARVGEKHDKLLIASLKTDQAPIVPKQGIKKIEGCTAAIIFYDGDEALCAFSAR